MEIKVQKWRVYLLFFVALAAGNIAVECLWRIPRGEVLKLVLSNSVVPAVVTTLLYFLRGGTE